MDYSFMEIFCSSSIADGIVDKRDELRSVVHACEPMSSPPSPWFWSG